MRILIAIPVFNEEKYVTTVLDRVRRYSNDILVIDDGSTDRTPILLTRQPVEVIRHPTNRGYGRSVRDAFRWAQCYCFDWLITMDCDEQHEPESLPTFFEAIREDQADVISGSRYLESPLAKDPPPADRRAINGQITQWINDRVKLRITDAFCGFKAYRVAALKRLQLTESGYALPLQMWIQIAAEGLRVTEVPIRLIYKDPNRSFGGLLDDPQRRLHHYREVFETEMQRYADHFAGACCITCATRHQDQAERLSGTDGKG